ncbi:unnamed protein product [Mytilus coruscus]|uniref:G-protein coupled receptors family 1 profile domain-containing protein n=1 Tax=Mytilus coruscus TaxID=42192 RepID=A0A6J8B768_MYTCO|nr:unnamed protein product [Mytilus coruscus]
MDGTGASFTLDPSNFTPFLNTTENGTILKLNKGIGWRPRIPVSSVVSFSLGIRLIINQSTVSKDRKADILALILASWNQVLDPWIYLLFRHEMLKRFVHLMAKSRGGLTLRRLVSFTGSLRSTSSDSETRHDTQSRQVQMDSFVSEELSSKNESKTRTSDVNNERMIQDNVSISDEV